MSRKKVVVVGLDGLEPSIVESLLERGDLPNFAKLRASGYYGRIQTTYPAQTPVAWSTFATGTNPGGHGIFDFVRRDPKTYQPDFALSEFLPPKNVVSPPRVVSLRKGVPVWRVLSQAGIPSVVLRCPCTFPPDTDCGKILAGVGVPDLRGGQGTGTFYTQDRTIAAKEHEQVVHLQDGDRLKTHVIGPRNTRTKPITDIISELSVHLDRERRALIFETNGTPAKMEVVEQQWSPWVRVKFKLSMLQSFAGLVRFYVKQLSPHVEFYCSPVNFDPAAPLYPISAPAGYARELSEKIGFFSTLGMAEDHDGHNNGRLDEDAYSAQCEAVFQEREQMMFSELSNFTEGFFFTLFDTPDRFQHMFWRFIDPQHPCYERDLAEQYGSRVADLYRRCDRLVGRVLDKVDENTLLVVLSDHGFNSFRRAFDTNTWLWQQGLLALKDGKKPHEERGIAFQSVDWSKTYAYAVGLGGIYLNARGREQGGIVEEGAEAERVRNAITRGLPAALDCERQSPAICSVSRREELYSGPYLEQAPDLLVNFMPGYRVSWQSAVGGFADTPFSDNTRRWSGDHIIDPESVPGMLFMNRAVTTASARMVDMAPTILEHLQVAQPEFMEGKALL
ncbi:MAG TPA: alkaline phosphatase family protein [Terriglobales bacterium]|nr:alkaline phosphatase family protein [Terriglobales bacterium]